MEKHIEQIARACRDTFYHGVIEDKAWNDHQKAIWSRDACTLLEKLDKLGLALVEKKSAKLPPPEPLHAGLD